MMVMRQSKLQQVLQTTMAIANGSTTLHADSKVTQSLLVVTELIHTNVDHFSIKQATPLFGKGD